MEQHHSPSSPIRDGCSSLTSVTSSSFTRLCLLSEIQYVNCTEQRWDLPEAVSLRKWTAIHILSELNARLKEMETGILCGVSLILPVCLTWLQSTLCLFSDPSPNPLYILNSNPKPFHVRGRKKERFKDYTTNKPCNSSARWCKTALKFSYKLMFCS